MVSRRSFLAGIAGAAVAGRSVGAATTRQPDVLVIGAGLAGLYSAMLLEELGARVEVLEGRDRIGGRLYTRFDLPGHPEVGGNTIASGYGRVRDVAQRLDVELIDYAPRLYASRPPELVLDGELIPADQWPASAHNPLPEAHRELLPWQIPSVRLANTNPLKSSGEWLDPANAFLDRPLHDWFVDHGLSDAEIALGYDTSPYFGDSAWSVSTLMYLFNERWIAEQGAIGQAAYAVAGGNQRLPETMAASLAGEVRIGHEVVAIESARDRVRVYLRDGRSLEARQVVCSVPVSKLRDIRVSPGFEGRQREAVHSLRYMRNTLVFLVPRKPFWEQDGLSPTMWTNGIAGFRRRAEVRCGSGRGDPVLS